jgi:hypothetical protein
MKKFLMPVVFCAIYLTPTLGGMHRQYLKKKSPSQDILFKTQVLEVRKSVIKIFKDKKGDIPTALALNELLRTLPRYVRLPVLNKTSYNPLCKAVAWKLPATLETLLDHGAHVGRLRKRLNKNINKNILTLACQAPDTHFEIIKILVGAAQKRKILARLINPPLSRYKVSPLSTACFWWQGKTEGLEAIEYLLDLGADPLGYGRDNAPLFSVLCNWYNGQIDFEKTYLLMEILFGKMRSLEYRSDDFLENGIMRPLFSLVCELQDGPEKKKLFDLFMHTEPVAQVLCTKNKMGNLLSFAFNRGHPEVFRYLQDYTHVTPGNFFLNIIDRFQGNAEELRKNLSLLRDDIAPFVTRIDEQGRDALYVLVAGVLPKLKAYEKLQDTLSAKRLIERTKAVVEFLFKSGALLDTVVDGENVLHVLEKAKKTSPGAGELLNQVWIKSTENNNFINAEMQRLADQ